MKKAVGLVLLGMALIIIPRRSSRHDSKTYFLSERDKLREQPNARA